MAILLLLDTRPELEVRVNNDVPKNSLKSMH